jgi:hypothetical protein
MNKLKEKFLLPAMCSALLAIPASTIADNIDQNEGSSFLDEVQSYSNYETTCSKNGTNGVVLSNDLNERKFLSMGDIQKFIDDSKGISKYQDTREALLKIKEDFWKTVTRNTMRGRGLSKCRV